MNPFVITMSGLFEKESSCYDNYEFNNTIALPTERRISLPYQYQQFAASVCPRLSLKRHHELPTVLDPVIHGGCSSHLLYHDPCSFHATTMLV